MNQHLLWSLMTTDLLRGDRSIAPPHSQVGHEMVRYVCRLTRALSFITLTMIIWPPVFETHEDYITTYREGRGRGGM